MPLSARGFAALVGCVGLCISIAAQAQSAAASPGARDLPFPLNAPPGFHVELVSNRVGGARFITAAPNGDILVAEISRGVVVAVHPGSPPDAQPTLVAGGLALPNAVEFRGNDLYIAVWSGVVVIRDYPRGIGSPRVLFDDMPRNGDHNARALALDPAGGIFISSGSDCNVCREEDPRLATILHYGSDGSGGRIYASGLRNASGLAIDPRGRLWAVVNQRDNLTPDHTDLPPDELDLIQQGGNYGWPTTYPIGDKRLPSPEFPGASTEGILPTTFNFPGPLGSPAGRVLQCGTIPGPVPRRLVCRISRLLEPESAHRLQGCCGHISGRRSHEGGRFPDRLADSHLQGPRKARRSRGSRGRLLVRERRHRLPFARPLWGLIRSGGPGGELR